MRFSVWRRKISSLVFYVIFLNLFLFHTFGSVTYSFLVIGFFLFTLSLYVTRELWPKQKSTILIFGTFLLSLLLILVNRDTRFVVYFLGLSCFVSLGLFLYLISTRITFFRSLLEFILVPANLGLSYLKAGLNLLAGLITSKAHVPAAKSVNVNNVKPLLVGLLIGLPVVFVLVVLFTGADPIYAKFIRDLLSLKLTFIPINLQIRIVFSLFWLAVLAPLLLLTRKSKFRSPLSLLERVAFTREMSVVLTLVALVLGSFLVIQAPYVFVRVPAETDLSRFGVATYSEYVKRGFAELLFISFFIYSLIWLGLLFLRGKTRTEQGYLRYIQLFVLGEFGVFLFSIFRRIWLYQFHHGWSLGRIYGGLFLLWLTAITLTLLARHFRQKKWVLVEMGFTAAFILLVGLFNAEHFIATTHPPTVNKRIDYVYLSRMSTDGYAGWKMAYAYSEDVLVTRRLEYKSLINDEERRDVAYAGLALAHLTRHYDRLIHRYGTDTQLRDYTVAVLDFLDSLSRYEYNRLSNSGSDATTEATKGKIVEIADKLAAFRTRLISLPYQRAREVNFYNPFMLVFAAQYTPCSFYEGVFCDSFYWWTGESVPVSPVDQLGTFDHLLAANGARFKTYAAMSRDIGYQKLLNLQKQYFLLYHKIASQLPEERGFVIDISFATPFL